MRFRGRRRGPQKAPEGLYGDDVGLYKQISEKYREITGMKEAPEEPSDGAIFAWAYAQYGIPSFACRLWTRPEASAADGGDDKSDKAGDDKEHADEHKAGKGGEADEDEAKEGNPPEGDDNARASRRRGRPGAEGAGPPHRGRGGRFGKKDDKKGNSEDLAWLKYSDDKRGGAGFVPWAHHPHPQLGDVEIGGFAPFFKIVPPPEEVEQIAKKQFEFVLDIGGRLPDVSVMPPHVTRLSDTVYEIETEVINKGYFPTALAIAELNRRVPPIVVTLNVDLTRILGGERVSKIWSIPGSGGRHKLRWVVHGEPGSTVSMDVNSEKFGNRKIDFVLAPTAEGEGS